MLAKRSKRKELIDLGHDFYSQKEYEQCLKILFRINKLLGSFKQVVKLLKRFPKEAVLVDVGCGGGLFLLHLNHYYPDMRMLGLDTSAEAIKLAQNELKQWQQRKRPIGNHLEFQLQHQAELTLEQDSVDIILLTLVCHHLDDEELIEFLIKASNATRKAVIINDLHRHSIAYYFYKLLSPLFGNRLITLDGLTSIQKGFTRKELKHLLQRANLHNYQIKWHFPFRWSILILKNKG